MKRADLKKAFKANRTLILAVTIVLFLFGGLFTHRIVAPRYANTLVIQATGEKNPESGGYSAGISLIKWNGRARDLRYDFEDWRYSNGVLLLKADEGPFVLRVPIYSSVKISFTKNTWAGIIRIRDSKGYDEKIDLYSPGNETYVYEYKAAPLRQIVGQMWPVAAALAAELLLALLLSTAVFAYLPVKKYPEDPEKRDVAGRLYRYAGARPATVLRLAIVGGGIFAPLVFCG